MGFEAKPDPRVQVFTVGNAATRVLVVDDLLTGASDLVEHAAESATLAPVKAATNFYPGVRAPAPQAYVQALVRNLRPYMSDVFGVPAGGRAGVTCALSMATTPASEATLVQRLPHIDTTDPCQLAVLHYLCGPEHGGTAFYRHRETGLEVIEAARSRSFMTNFMRQMAETPMGSSYIRDSDALFEKIGAVDAAFNRIVVYPSRLLHAGVLPDQPAGADPRTGRLTVNTFYRYEAG